MQRTGVLLINLGTPDDPSVPAVRRYLREFLSDPRVIDLPALGRWLLLNLIILPFRPRRSAHAYRQIWSPEGSPLLLHSQKLTAAVQQNLGDEHVVRLAMRYGSPSIDSAVESLIGADVERIVALPLFPQYSSAATGSAVEKLYDVVAARADVPPVEVRPSFFAATGFIESFRAVATPVLAEHRPDHVLFSYHGLPERHVARSDQAGLGCDRQGPCPLVGSQNRHCYRAQCYATTTALAAALGLDADGYSTAFQSRLGRTPWIRPYLDDELPRLRALGKKRLAILCPAFVADCLETLEEIGMRARVTWKELGGEELWLVPSLNGSAVFARFVADWVGAAGSASR